MDLLTGLPSLLPRPTERKFDLQSIQQLRVKERLIPLSTLYFFIDFSFEGNLPSGGKTTLQLINEEEVPLLPKPYAQWAPDPWKNTSSSMQERLFDTPDQFQVEVPRRISCMRARLWEGMTPMSGAQWKERKLDDTANWQSVFEFLFDIIHTFEFLGHPDIQVALKNNFNHVAGELETFGSALNARREEQGIQSKVDMGALWLEYIKDLFETMVTRTHSFFLRSVKTTITKARAIYNAVADEKGAANAHEEAKRFGGIWSDLERALHRADSYIMMPLDGYTGFISSPSDASTPVGSLLPLPLRWDQQRELRDKRSWPMAEQFENDPTALYTDRTNFLATVDEADENNDQVRLQLRGQPKPLEREPWINIIHSRTQWSLSRGGPQDQKWGFVCYMLTRTPSHQEWESFLSKVYTDFHASGEWVQGFETVKKNMDIQWIHGEDSGIPHDDIEAAQRHFRIFRTSSHIRKRVWKMDFLVVDSECFASYMTPQPNFGDIACSGDNGGFLKLIDTATYPPELVRQTSPGFSNEMKVLGRLIFDDLYPLLSGLVQRPRNLWPLAMLHPNQVYVGFPVKGQMVQWESMWKARAAFWHAFCYWRDNQGS